MHFAYHGQREKRSYASVCDAAGPSEGLESPEMKAHLFLASIVQQV